MAYNPNDPYGIGDLYGGNFDPDPSFFTSPAVLERVRAAENAGNVFGGTPYVSPVTAPPAPQAPPATTVVPPPPLPVPPSPWNMVPTFTRPSGIKQADPDIVIDPEINTTGDYIVERFFEELGGTELINLSRHDLIDGIDVSYTPIANLSRLRRRFNPNNLIALDILSDNEFSKFSINLLSRGMNEPFFDDQGNLVVEIDIIRPEENIEVEISLTGTVTRIEL